MLHQFRTPLGLRHGAALLTTLHRLSLVQGIHRKSRQEKATEKSFGEWQHNSSRITSNEEERFRLYKGWGQHLLTNTRILDTIVRKSDIRPTDTVLEIGPGTGNLTLKLLEAGHKVVAVEIDKRMADALAKRVANSGVEQGLTVICKDALKTDFPHFDIVVANIPYGISSPLIAKLVFGVTPFRSATLLLQKEFARRLMANPGDSEFNRLAVNVKLVAEVDFIMDVSKREFVPNPKVDSSVIRIRPKSQVPEVDLDEWLAFTRACFGKKNKTLGATFKQKKKVVELMRLSTCPVRLDEEKVDVASNNRGEDIKDDNDNDNDDDVDEEDEMCSVNRRNSDLVVGVSSFRGKIVEVLRSNGFEEKRPLKLSIEELLHLLSLFNQQDIYFHCKTKSVSTDCNAVRAHL